MDGQGPARGCYRGDGRVLFNFTDYSNPSTININVNGHMHSMAWPYPDNGGSSWRTLSYVIPISELVAGDNTLAIGGDTAIVTSNVNIVLVNAATPVSTPTPAPVAEAPTLPG